MNKSLTERISPILLKINKNYLPGMSFPAYILADKLIEEQLEEEAIKQLASISLLPGLLANPWGMPDIHTGYGFPIGGVAAFSLQDGIISPGGVGYDINCGMRLIGSMIYKDEIKKVIPNLTRRIFQRVPVGVGATSLFKLNHKDLKKVIQKGACWVWEKIGGEEEGWERIEENGFFEDTEFKVISKKAIKRGISQLGTLGGGNHFIEISYLDEIYSPQVAQEYSLFKDQIVILFHSGSRGFGHQIATDYLQVMKTQFFHNFPQAVSFPKLCCSYFTSSIGEDYYLAMNSAANWAWANRSLIAEEIIKSFEEILKASRKRLGIYLISDISHNIARKEEIYINGEKKKALIHRKGATRAVNRDNPVLIILPGDMERGSYLLKGTEKAERELLNSVSHGAGRVLSRRKAMKLKSAGEVLEELENKGIEVLVDKLRNLPQEMPAAYKDIDRVVSVLERGGFIEKVARIKSLSVIKG